MKYAIALLTLFCGSLPVMAADGPDPKNGEKAVRLLTIGNSFSKNTTRFLPDIVSAAGHRLIHTPIVVGGASLELHAQKAQRHESNPLDPAGLYANGTSLKQELGRDKWDFVTIQQASIKSHDVTTFRPFAAWLCDYIRQHAPGAEVLLHQTWAYRCDDPRFKTDNPKPGEPTTQAEMYRGLRDAYGSIAKELRLRQLPVGDAFNLADTDPKWGFVPDTTFSFKTAKYPALPDQTHSGHVGWQWKTLKDDTRVIRMDGHHANMAGEYLGACVWFEVLFDADVVGNAFVPPGMDRAHARFLQEIAHRAAAPSRAQARPAQSRRSGLRGLRVLRG